MYIEGRTIEDTFNEAITFMNSETAKVLFEKE